MKQYKLFAQRGMLNYIEDIKKYHYDRDANLQKIENSIWLKLSADGYFALHGDKFSLEKCIENTIKNEKS